MLGQISTRQSYLHIKNGLWTTPCTSTPESNPWAAGSHGPTDGTGAVGCGDVSVFLLKPLSYIKTPIVSIFLPKDLLSGRQMIRRGGLSKTLGRVIQRGSAECRYRGRQVNSTECVLPLLRQTVVPFLLPD